MPPLEHILEDLLAAADAAEPNQAKIRLTSGLTLNLRKDGDMYRLLLWRVNVHPSHTEWNTVCSHWPYPVGTPNPHKGNYGIKYYLQGSIPGHPKFTDAANACEYPADNYAAADK